MHDARMVQPFRKPVHLEAIGRFRGLPVGPADRFRDIDRRDQLRIRFGENRFAARHLLHAVLRGVAAQEPPDHDGDDNDDDEEADADLLQDAHAG